MFFSICFCMNIFFSFSLLSFFIICICILFLLLVFRRHLPVDVVLKPSARPLIGPFRSVDSAGHYDVKTVFELQGSSDWFVENKQLQQNVEELNNWKQTSCKIFYCYICNKPHFWGKNTFLFAHLQKFLLS